MENSRRRLPAGLIKFEATKTELKMPKIPRGLRETFLVSCARREKKKVVEIDREEITLWVVIIEESR